MKTVLITGASRGIGASIASLLASEGYHIIITAHNSKESLHNLAQTLMETYQVPCEAYPCDMSQYDEVEALFQKIPPIDVLINNAGISYVGLLSDMSYADWQNVVDTNLSSCFYTCKLAIPNMVHKQDGCIINISSVWGNAGASMEVAYSASKGAVNAFTKALAKELAPSHISVNAIAPGVIDTEMNKHISADEKECLIAEIPADRYGTPGEIAEMVYSIINAPKYLTGQVITVDGGWQ